MSIKLASNIDFYSGQILVDSPDVDHVLSLHQSYPEACKWSAKKRNLFGNDQTNLRPTTASMNRSKGSQGPGEWSPASKKYACAYHEVFREVVAKWHLESTVTDADKEALKLVC